MLELTIPSARERRAFDEAARRPHWLCRSVRRLCGEPGVAGDHDTARVVRKNAKGEPTVARAPSEGHPRFGPRSVPHLKCPNYLIQGVGALARMREGKADLSRPDPTRRTDS